MSDIVGSTKAGPCTIKYDVDPSAETVTLGLYYYIELGSVTLTSTQLTGSVGGSYGGTTCKASFTVDWSTNKVTYNLTVDSPMSKKKSYSGTVVSW